MPTWSFRTILTTDEGVVLDQENTVVAPGIEGDTIDVPASTTGHIALTIDHTKILGFRLASNKNVILRTNDPVTSADGDIALAAGVAQFFPGPLQPFGTNLTSVHVVNGVGAGAHVEVYFLVNNAT